MNKRQITAQETKNKLIAAALEILKNKGVTAINVDEITQKPVFPKEHFTFISNEKKTLFWIFPIHFLKKLPLTLKKRKMSLFLKSCLSIFAISWNVLNFAALTPAVNGHGTF